MVKTLIKNFYRNLISIHVEDTLIFHNVQIYVRNIEDFKEMMNVWNLIGFNRHKL